MQESTVAIYEREAARWRERREPTRRPRAQAFAALIPDGVVRADLGCGPGSYLEDLGHPVVALDAASAMLDLVPDRSPGAMRVQADLEWLPFRRGALGAAWASMSYLHVPRARLPLALAHLHGALSVGAPVHIDVIEGDIEGTRPDDDFPGRFFADWHEDSLRAVLVGAGFTVVDLDRERGSLFVTARRERTLPDFVAPGMRVLVCGLNPSLYAADAGVGFARPGNRFWPAAIAAGLVTRPRDPFHALHEHGVGMTDLVKRATATAREVTATEYREGLARVERLVEWLAPRVVCFVGLDGWRRAVDRRAQPGPQAQGFGGAAVYLMPSTSGLNARVPLPDLTAHLRAATALA